MHRHQLPLNVRGQLGDGTAAVLQAALDFVATSLTLCRALEVEQALVPARELNPNVAEPGGPAPIAVERVERGLITRGL